LPKRSAESVNAAGKIQLLQHMELALVQAHSVTVVEIDQSRVKGAVVSRGESNPVPHMIRASGCSDWEYVRRIHQTKLDARHGAAVAIGKYCPLLKGGVSS